MSSGTVTVLVPSPITIFPTLATDIGAESTACVGRLSIAIVGLVLIAPPVLYVKSSPSPVAATVKRRASYPDAF